MSGTLRGHPNPAIWGHLKSGQWEVQDLALKIGCGKDGSCAVLEIALRFPRSHNLCDGFDLADIPEHPKDWHSVG